MLREQARLFTRLNVVADTLTVVAAFLLAYWIRHQFAPPLQPLTHYTWALLVIVPLWIFLLTRFQLFASIRRLSSFDILVRLLNVHLWGAIGGAGLIFFIDRQLFSRGLYLLFLAASFLLLSLSKCSVRSILGALRRRGYNYRRILIVGTREKAQRFHQLLEEHAEWGLRVIGFVQASDTPLRAEVDGHKVLGHVTDLIEICKRNTVDEVVFCLPKDIVMDAEEYVQSLEELGITVRMALDFFALDSSRKELSFFHDEIPILTFHTKNLDAQQALLKRGIDIAGGIAGLLGTAILFPLIALAIKLESPGPIFFCQKRVGMGGRIFRCWKFRTMYKDAGRKRRQLARHNEMKGAIFKIRQDPRITRVGRFLRRTSLDELPQFWNVLKGEMSLVGTRPPTLGEVKRYENWHRRRISIKPGITGMWQVSGRNEISDFDQIVKLDLKYIDQWSLWLDVKILLKTLAVVFARRGSC